MSNSYECKASRIGLNLHPPSQSQRLQCLQTAVSHKSQSGSNSYSGAFTEKHSLTTTRAKNTQAGTGGNIQPRRRQVTLLYSPTACNRRPRLGFQVSQPAQFLHCKRCQRRKTWHNVNDKRRAKMFKKLIATKNSLLYSASV